MAAMAGTSCASVIAKNSAAAATSAAFAGERQPPQRDRARRRPGSSGSANAIASAAPHDREAREPAQVLRGARQGQREHQLQALVVDFAQGAGRDLRGDQEYRAGAQQRRDDGSLQRAALGHRDLGQEAASGEASDDARGGEPGQAAAARLEQHQTGENGRRHGFVCRLVAVQPRIMEPSDPRS